MNTLDRFSFRKARRGQCNASGLASVLLAVGLVSGCLTEVLAREPVPPRSGQIRKVQSGELREARADWWGFDPVDATASLQAALDSGVPRLVVPNMGTPWIVHPIHLRSNQEIEFEDGVVVEAIKDGFHGRKDSLFNGLNVSNVVLRGSNVVWRMHKRDYQDPDRYQRAEWRHTLNLLSCFNIQAIGLTLRSSGGDGVYVGSAHRPINFCKDIVIRDCTIEEQHRQGISVISVRGLRIENCIIRDTAGTPPQAGIDFEPNARNQWLQDIVVRNSRFENNKGGAVILFAFPGADSHPISFRFENCVAVSNRFTGGFGPRPPFDKIEVVATNCVEIVGGETRVIHDFWRDWQNMRVLGPVERAVVERCGRVAIEEAALRPLTEAFHDLSEKPTRQPLLRRRANYLLLARKAGEQVRFNVILRRKTRHGMTIGVKTLQGTSVPLVQLATDGEPAALPAAPTQTLTERNQKGAFVFTAPAPGAYRVECDPGSGWFDFEPVDRRAAFVALDGPVNFFGRLGTGTFYFYVPAGTREFYLDAAGMGGEKVKVTLFDAAGNVVHEQDPVSLSSSFVVTRPADAPAEVWSVRTTNAEGFYLEDHSLDLFGVPPIFATDPESLLIPDVRR